MNIADLQGQRLVVSAEPLDFSENQRLARSGIRGWRFLYRSLQGLVEGFICCPDKDGPFPAIVFNKGASNNRLLFDVSDRILGPSPGMSKEDHLELRIGTPYNLFSRVFGLVRNGFLVAASQYSGCGLSQGLDEYGGRDVEDVVRIVEILLDLPSVNPAKLGMLGICRGALMGFKALADLRMVSVRHFVAINAAPNLSIWAHNHSYMKHELNSCFEPSYIEFDRRNILKMIDALPTDLSVLNIHGQNDRYISQAMIERMNHELRGRIGDRLSSFLVPSTGHAIFEGENGAFMWSKLVEWLRAVLL